MKYELYTRVALATDLPEHRLRRGDVATLVESHAGRSDQEPGYTLEVFTATGETVTVVTVRESQIEPLNSGEVLSVRQLHSAAIRDGLTQSEVFELVGRMLFKLHAFEQLLGNCTAILVATNRNHATEGEIDATELIGKMGSKACGFLVAELRKVVNIESTFERLLRRLVRRRNRFAHKLSWKRAFNPSLEAKALKNIPAFVFRLDADVDQAWEVFANYAEAIARQSDGDATCIEYEKLVVPFLTLKPQSRKQ